MFGFGKKADSEGKKRNPLAVKGLDFGDRHSRRSILAFLAIAPFGLGSASSGPNRGSAGLSGKRALFARRLHSEQSE